MKFPVEPALPFGTDFFVCLFLERERERRKERDRKGNIIVREKH